MCIRDRYKSVLSLLLFLSPLFLSLSLTLFTYLFNARLLSSLLLFYYINVWPKNLFSHCTYLYEVPCVVHYVGQAFFTKLPQYSFYKTVVKLFTAALHCNTLLGRPTLTFLAYQKLARGHGEITSVLSDEVC